MDPISSDFEHQLQQHGRSLRNLAHELLRGSDDVDDMLQETWLRALVRPPRHDAHIGGWLALVLRHTIGRSRRSDRRRERRERLAAGGDVTTDPADAVVRAETARQVLAAVQRLDPPFRAVIWQRFFEDLPPREMAARSGVPIATVKSRLQRGLQQLRERLGEEGESSDWRGALALAFGFDMPQGTATAGTVAAATGGLTMAAWGKFVATLVVAGVAAWWLWPQPSAARTPALGATTGDAIAQVADTDRVGAPGSASPGDTPIVEREVAAAAADRPDRAAATVRGRCVDAGGAPLAECLVRIEAHDKPGQLDEWLRDHPNPGWNDLEQTTGADGAFAFTFWPPPPLRFMLRVARTGSTPLGGSVAVAPGAVVEVGNVVLRSGVVVTGTVVDAQQRPVPGIEVVANEKVERRSFEFHAASADRPAVQLRAEVPHAASREDGRFAFSVPLAAGEWTLQLVHGGAWRDPHPLRLRDGLRAEDVRLTCSLPADAPTIRGTVVDAEGVGVGGAVIRLGEGSGTLQYDVTDAAGAFCLRRTPDPRIGDLVVLRATHAAHVPSEPTPELAWGTADVALRLPRGSSLVVRVTDADRRPVEDFTVRVASRMSRESDETRVRARGPFADGTAIVRGLEHGEWLVGIEFPTAAGLATHVQPFSLDGDVGRIDVRAERIATRRLRVVRADGTPVIGSRVELLDHAPTAFDANCKAENLAVYLRRAANGLSFPVGLLVLDGVTGAEGALELHGSAARLQALRVLGPGHIAHCDAAVDLTQPGELVVRVQDGARLVARITTPAAIDELRRRAGIGPGQVFAADRTPSLQLFQPAPAGAFERAWPAARGDARARMTVDGRFELDAIPPGTWHVGIAHWHIQGPSMASLDRVAAQEVSLADGDVREIDVDLGFLLPGTLEGVVLHNGEPMANAQLSVQPVTGSQGASRTVETDAAGHFRLLLVPARYTLRAVLDRGTPQSRYALAGSEVDVFRDRVTRQTFAVVTGALTVRLRHHDGTAATGVVLRLGDDRPRGARLAPTDREGTTRTDWQVGRFTVFAARSRDDHVPLGVAELQPGGSASIELVLPEDW